MKVLGLDLSLSATGLVDAGSQRAFILKPRKRTGLTRLRWIRDEILTHATDADLVVIEGPSYGSQGPERQSGHHERAGLWWIATEALDTAGVQLAVVAPAAMKKYATGVGNASKDQVLVAASKRFEWFTGGNDEADALWLSAIGYDLAESPVLAMPAFNRAVLQKVEWPQAA